MDQLPSMPVTNDYRTQGRDLRRVGAHPDHWYPVAWSPELKDKPLGVRWAGEPIVLVRPKTGPVYALEDRCAHRQVPLSLGVVAEANCDIGLIGYEMALLVSRTEATLTPQLISEMRGSLPVDGATRTPVG